MLAPSIVLGLGVTVAALFAIRSGFSSILGTIIIVLSLLIAGVLGVVGIGLSSELPGIDTEEDERLKTLRAAQRAMIEEMDEMIEILGEIRDTLKSTGESD